MTIKFHYHNWGGPRRCHVYSDETWDELIRWATRKAIPERWLHDHALPHFDLWGAQLLHCGLGVTRGEFCRDLRAWREFRVAEVYAHYAAVEGEKR